MARLPRHRKAAKLLIESSVGLPKGDALADKLREYHKRGVDIQEHGSGHSEAELIDLFKVSKDQLYKTQAFARYYNSDELEALCADRDVDENPLRWAHVRELLVYRDDRKARLKLQKRAVRGCWTVDELREQIQRDRRDQSRVTGRRAGPRFKFSSIPELIRKSEEIERQLASLLATVGSDDEPRRRIDDLLAKATDADRDALRGVARKLTEIEQHVDRVRQAVTAATRKQRKVTSRK
jgi:hypothetical protein